MKVAKREKGKKKAVKEAANGCGIRWGRGFAVFGRLFACLRMRWVGGWLVRSGEVSGWLVGWLVGGELGKVEVGDLNA